MLIRACAVLVWTMLVSVTCGPLYAVESKRVALVIGNQAYNGGEANPKGLLALGNSINDAASIATLLVKYGFDVTTSFDLDHDTFGRTIKRFAKVARTADTALIFYAGHGMQVWEGDNDFNVLAPVDAEIDCENLEQHKTIRFDEITRAMGGAKNQVIILDACRTSPFARCESQRGDQQRGAGFSAQELRAKSGKGIIMAFSTAKRRLASDGPNGGHSPFTNELLKAMEGNPRANFYSLMTGLVITVGKATAFAQVPSVDIDGGTVETCLEGRYCTELFEDVDSRRRLARSLARHSKQFYDRGLPVEAMLTAIESVRDNATGRDRGRGVERTLWNALSSNSERVVLAGHNMAVTGAAFSPDGRYVLTASADRIARLWDAETGTELRRYEGNADSILHAVFSPDGKRLVTSGWDGTARVWDTQSGAELMRFTHTGPLSESAFSPDGNSVISASLDGSTHIWDVARRVETLHLGNHGDQVTGATFSPDGKRVATASSDYLVRVWDAATGEKLKELRHEGRVASVAFSPDGVSLLTSTTNGQVLVWTGETGAVTKQFVGHTHAVLSAEFNRAGDRIVTASRDGSAIAWDANTGAVIRRFLGHKSYVVNASFSPDGTKIVTASQDGTARIWDVDCGVVREQLDGDVADISADGTRAAVLIGDAGLRLWDLKSKTSIELSGHTDKVWTATFSPDSSRLVTGSSDNTARVWNAVTGSELQRLVGHNGYIAGASFSQDGQRVVTASADTTARVWDVGTGVKLLELKGHTKRIWEANYCSNGPLIVTASYDRTARIWNAETGEEVRLLKGHADRILSAAFSPDCKRVVTGSWDRTARIWDAETGNELRKLEGHESFVYSVAFSPDGLRVVTGSNDRSSRVWDAGTGEELQRYDGHNSYVRRAIFSPDGRHVFTAGGDGTVRTQPSDPVPSSGDLVMRAKAAVPRCLPPTEWEDLGLPSQGPDWCREMGKWPYQLDTESWMAQLAATRHAFGVLITRRFKDPMYALEKPIAWKPNAGQESTYQPVEVPRGFVTDLASVPRSFFSLLRPDGEYAHAAVLHDWLYWEQSVPRETADQIFRQHMLDLGVSAVTAELIYKAVDWAGASAWRANTEAKAKGERRVLKRFPDQPITSWADWKLEPDVFE